VCFCLFVLFGLQRPPAWHGCSTYRSQQINQSKRSTAALINWKPQSYRGVCLKIMKNVSSICRCTSILKQKFGNRKACKELQKAHRKDTGHSRKFANESHKLCAFSHSLSLFLWTFSWQQANAAASHAISRMLSVVQVTVLCSSLTLSDVYY
jgi:hypothetical protein